MEKKRRARINQCLNELKTLILDALKKDPARHTKLEKADILEMTVRHLQSLHGNRQSSTSVNTSQPTDPSTMIVQKFQTGYQECVGEVNRFVDRLDGVDEDIKKRLISHLDSCVAKIQYTSSPPSYQNLHLDTTAAAAAALVPNCSSRLLPTGELALILPASTARRISAFTPVHQDDRLSLLPPQTSSVPYIYVDEPVSSTSTSAEDAHGVRNPLDFSLKKIPTGPSKRPLNDIPVNVPNASSSLHGGKAENQDLVESGQRAVTVERPRTSRCESPRDPNMWRPW
ncbi:protein deadpan-like isoform X2 [Daktulosphaira vitifoliae]|nr:protein deadpan-like isoform X2 [Daktulosphaira vitifoliae]